MNLIVTAYFIYLPVAVALTIWVGRTLFRNGRIFLLETFHNQAEIADSVNRLLLVGFYLINIGYSVYTLQILGNVEDVRQMIETLSIKIGLIILILGAMHFFNLFVFFQLRKRAKLERKVQHDDVLIKN
jgi:p-aminobenzoyl-glutamate transporter AbgT